MTQPTTAQLSAVAYSVAEGLRAAAFVPRGSVSLGYFSRKSLEEAGLVIAVLPRKSASESITRGGLKQADLAVEVGVFKKLEGTDSEIDQQVDELLWLCQQIEDYYAVNALPNDRKESLASATTDANGDADFDRVSLLEKREFAAFITLTFRGVRRP